MAGKVSMVDNLKRSIDSSAISYLCLLSHTHTHTHTHTHKKEGESSTIFSVEDSSVHYHIFNLEWENNS